ncbi:MAG TPA: hypothetical protein VGD65_25425 [Chryseosolibacter sp.]
MTDKFIIFLCSGAAKAGNKKLSFRVASQLESMGVGELGSLESLSHQHTVDPAEQRRMIFINDCRSGCVNVLTHGFQKEKYVYIDVSPFLTAKDFDIIEFIQSEVLTTLHTKWSYSADTEYQTV